MLVAKMILCDAQRGRGQWASYLIEQTSKSTQARATDVHLKEVIYLSS